MSLESLERFRQERREEAQQRRQDAALRRRTPIVSGKLLRCPDCRSTACKTTRTAERTADRVVRWQKCETCGLAFLNILD